MLPSMTLLSALFLFAFFCPAYNMFSERREWAAQTKSSGRSSQYLVDAIFESRTSRKDTSSSSKKDTMAEAYNTPNNRDVEAASTDSEVNANIRNLFSTHYGPGLHLFKDRLVTSTPPVQQETQFKDGALDEVDDNSQSGISDCLDDDHMKSEKVFCTRLRNYPDKSRLDKLIKENYANMELFFTEDLVMPQNISQRMNNAPNEEYFCRSRNRIVYPQSALNKNNDWLNIVNTPTYKQGIRIEECLDHGATCGENIGLTLPNHYTATCEQNYIYRSLVAYLNQTVIKDTFRVPSCCKCVLRSY